MSERSYDGATFRPYILNHKFCKGMFMIKLPTRSPPVLNFKVRTAGYFLPRDRHV